MSTPREEKHYNYFRDYDPAIGRYVESDPIGLKGGLSTYGYVRSPIAEIDALGRMGDRPGDESADTTACEYYQRICKATGGACRYYCATAPGMCNFPAPFADLPNKKLNCIRRCLVSEDQKAQSGHGFGAGPGTGSGSSERTCSGPHCQPDHVIDAYHRKCFMDCGVDPRRYPGVNPLGFAPDSPLNPNRGAQP